MRRVWQNVLPQVLQFLKPTDIGTAAPKIPMRFLSRLFAIAGGLGTRKPPRLVDRALKEIDRQPEVTLSMPQYLDLLAAVPLPTQQQKENFAVYVSGAHRWYKHLPYYLPGSLFCFFIDKYAGFDRVLLRDGTAAMRERVQRGREQWC